MCWSSKSSIRSTWPSSPGAYAKFVRTMHTPTHTLLLSFCGDIINYVRALLNTHRARTKRIGLCRHLSHKSIFAPDYNSCAFATRQHADYSIICSRVRGRVLFAHLLTFYHTSKLSFTVSSQCGCVAALKLIFRFRASGLSRRRWCAFRNVDIIHG